LTCNDTVQIENSTDGVMDRPVDIPEPLVARELQHFSNILKLIEICNREHNLDKKIQLLASINSVLPEEIQLRIPPLVTDDYVEVALYNLEMACKGQIKSRNHFLLSL
jgi:hypothetical protein